MKTNLTTIKTVNLELTELQQKEKELKRIIKNDYTRELIFFLTLLILVSILVTNIF